MTDEPDAVISFCRGMRPRLVGALSLHCGDRAVAEELAQETLVRVWERWARVRKLESPEGWAYRVAMNLATSWLRRRSAEWRVRRRLEGRAGHSDEVDRADILTVRAAVAALPERRRTALVLRYFCDLDVKETARAMSCAAGTVRALTAQAIEQLRRSELGAVEEDADV